MPFSCRKQLECGILLIPSYHLTFYKIKRISSEPEELSLLLEHKDLMSDIVSREKYDTKQEYQKSGKEIIEIRGSGERTKIKRRKVVFKQ